ncbi:hypothetical protein [Stutzerimonas frequens]|uniref:hypothetical protein n=1 Tax=Stutzerimonas frequens TaxID=2968969 RepID=UPI002553C4EF|nr:hypothetical protein [Stutzerimonas frequens]MDL0438227.1 hypothetical protein [Stutzerimonas frequens]
MSKFNLSAEVNGPVFFLHKNAAKGTDVTNLEIKEYYKTPEEIARWEKKMLDEVGLKIDGNALIKGGGSCCGTGGGACDAD